MYELEGNEPSELCEISPFCIPKTFDKKNKDKMIDQRKSLESIPS